MIASSGVLTSVSRTRRALTAVHAVRIGLTLAATALAVFAAWRLALVLGLASGAALFGAAMVAAVGAALSVRVGWRGRHVRDPLRVALWIEEHAPSLEFALVSAVDVRLRGAVPPPALEGLAQLTANAVPLGRAYQRGLIAPAAALVAAALVALGAGALREDSRATRLIRDLARPGAATRGALGRVTVTVRPPAYTRRAPVELRDPVAVRALAGSDVAISGQQSGEVLEASLGPTALRVERRGAGWRLGLTVGARAAIVRLRTPSEQRLLSIEPVADSLPVVRLVVPARDTVFAAAPQSVRLEAEMTDDNGLASAEFDYIVSTGEGESFTFRSGRLAAQSLGGRQTASLRADFSLPALGLGPGDVLHLRAIARDQNTITGPGVGSSDTRVLRIQRVGEGDSVAVEGAAPPPADSSLMSQRMLIVLTEALVRRRPRITRAVLTDESRSLARQQSRLRRVVGDAVFARLGNDGSGEHTHDDGHDHSADTLSATTAEALLKAAEQATDARTQEALDVEGDETPIVAVNRPLLEAFNAMWAAQRELELADPVKALPHMHAALAAIQRARTAERILLRSRPPNVVVDIDRVRLSGKDKGANAARDARRPDDAGERAADRFVRAMAILRDRPSEAADSLLALRVDLLGDDDRAAQALATAVEGLRRGVTDTAALQLARRALGAGARYVGQLSPLERRAVSEFVFATAQYESGDWDSAPLVPANVIDSIARYTKLPVAPRGVVIPLASNEVLRYPLVFLTGHLPVRLTAAEGAMLRRFVDRGGMLFIDDHNHDIDGAFHKTAIDEIGRTIAPLVPLPNDHAIYRTFFTFADGPPNTSHELNGWGDNLVHKNLLAVQINGRIAVLYSNKDYSSEWSYHPENKRFFAVDNTKFAVNIVVYALTR